MLPYFIDIYICKAHPQQIPNDIQKIFLLEIRCTYVDKDHILKVLILVFDSIRDHIGDHFRNCTNHFCRNGRAYNYS